MPRPQKCRCICSRPKVKGFTPMGHESGETVIIGYDEYEAVRLLDYVKLTQEQCAKKMNISRPTVTRIYEEVRQKIADAMVNGKEIRIEGGDVIVCEAMKPECVNEVHCCHKQK